MASSWGKSWGSSWGNSWGTIAEADTVEFGGGGGARDMGEEDHVRRTRKREDTVRTEILKSMGEWVDVIPADPLVKKREQYDESDDLESIMWLQ